MITLFHWWDLYSHFYMCFLSFTNFESHFFEVFETFIAAHWEHILIEIVEFCVVALGDHPQHIWIDTTILNGFFFEPDGDVKLFDWAREKHTLAEDYIGTTGFHVVFGLRLLISISPGLRIFRIAGWLRTRLLLGLRRTNRLIFDFELGHSLLDLLDSRGGSWWDGCFWLWGDLFGLCSFGYRTLLRFFWSLFILLLRIVHWSLCLWTTKLW